MIMNEKKNNIYELESYDFDNYKNIDLNSLAVYAISILLEKNIPTTFEIIVVTLFRLFPKKFSLEGFDEYPDAARINRALLQLRPKYRNWAHGDVQLGYSLTEEGMHQAAKVKLLLEKSHLQKPLKSASKKRTLATDAEVTDIEKSKVFLSYKEGKEENITDLDIYTLFKAYSYTPPKVLRDYLDKLKGYARFNKRKDIIDFLNWIEKKYSRIFRKK